MTLTVAAAVIIASNTLAQVARLHAYTLVKELKMSESPTVWVCDHGVEMHLICYACAKECGATHSRHVVYSQASDIFKRCAQERAKESAANSLREQAEDAAKWRALRNCSRVVAGPAQGIYSDDDDAFITLSFWTRGIKEPVGRDRIYLDKFVAKCRKVAESK